MDRNLILGLALAKKLKPQTVKNPHADPSKPPRISNVNPKLESVTVRSGSTDRACKIDIVVKSGPANDITSSEALFTVRFGTPYEGDVQCIGIPASPQTAGYSAESQTRDGYTIYTSGLGNGSIVTLAPICIDATES